MEKYKRNLPYVLFITLGLKLIALGANSLFDVFALLVLGMGLAFFELRVENAKFSEMSKKITDLEKKDTDKAAEMQKLKETINSVRTVTGMKQTRLG